MLEEPGVSWRDVMGEHSQPKKRWPICRVTPFSMGDGEGTGLR